MTETFGDWAKSMAHHAPLLRRGPGVGGTANLYERVLTLAEVESSVPRTPRAPRAPRALPAPSGASLSRARCSANGVRSLPVCSLSHPMACFRSLCRFVHPCARAPVSAALPAGAGARWPEATLRHTHAHVRTNTLQDSKAIILPVAGNIAASYNFCNIGYAVQLMRLEHPVLASFSPRLRTFSAQLSCGGGPGRACCATRSLHTQISARASALAGVPVRRFVRQRPELP